MTLQQYIDRIASKLTAADYEALGHVLVEVNFNIPGFRQYMRVECSQCGAWLGSEFSLNLCGSYIPQGGYLDQESEPFRKLAARTFIGVPVQRWV